MGHLTATKKQEEAISWITCLCIQPGRGTAKGEVVIFRRYRGKKIIVEKNKEDTHTHNDFGQVP